ncbi:acyl-homoserine-lactone synthase [Sphingomonas sp. 1P08PE]|uniref:acyl-homoserine-lactone synthase n=1 Tax=Sphingomonas sp. 1P08PE TaxID=554122 RepID=UPI00399FE7BD
MLHVAEAGRTHVPDTVLRTMFAARKDVFVDLLKWDVPVVEHRYEIDQFDDEHASYLILVDGDGRHLGSTRLLPTSRPHILDSLYAELCDGTPPTGPTTLEITRFCLDRRLRAAERRAVRDTLVVGLVDHALAHGITCYTAVAEFGWFQQILAFGWRCRPLGLPRSIEGATLAAMRIEIDGRTPALLATAGIRAQADLLHCPQRAAA